jgi:hypothetical protein
MVRSHRLRSLVLVAIGVGRRMFLAESNTVQQYNTASLGIDHVQLRNLASRHTCLSGNYHPDGT